jgi:hypothetical protein
MEERYNVYFDGQVMAGHDLGSVREKLAKVFNADQATLDKLFSGKRQLIKRSCDAATAQKFKAAMERAGAVPIINVEEPAAVTAAAPARPLTAAEKIAALAAAADETRYRQSSTTQSKAALQEETNAASGGIALAPPGTEVLRAEERATPIVREVDTSGLAVDSAATRLSDVPPPPPAAPDTSHLTMGGVGESIPNLPSDAVPLFPDLDGLELSAPGTDFSDCAAPTPAAAPLNLSGLAALPPGDLPPEEERLRQRIPVPVPSTDHLALKD